MAYGFWVIKEETGASFPESTRLTKFASGKRRDWFYVLIHNTKIFPRGYRAEGLEDVYG